MKLFKEKLVVVLAGLMVVTAAWAADSQDSKDEKMDADALRLKIEQQLQVARPELRVNRVDETEIEGLYSVLTMEGMSLYTTADGKYILDGKMYRVEKNMFVDVRDERLQPLRAKALADIPGEDMIVFSPEGEAKAHVYVFTDVDCGYCQKLHHEMDDINAYGIEVRYLAFPRAGANSRSGQKLVSAWCSDDKLTAMDRLKSRQPIPDKTCPNPVAAQLNLGQSLGVRGTPAIFRADGSSIPGYRPAEQLAADLGLLPPPALRR